MDRDKPRERSGSVSEFAGKREGDIISTAATAIDACSSKRKHPLTLNFGDEEDEEEEDYGGGRGETSSGAKRRRPGSGLEGDIIGATKKRFPGPSNPMSTAKKQKRVSDGALPSIEEVTNGLVPKLTTANVADLVLLRY